MHAPVTPALPGLPISALGHWLAEGEEGLQGMSSRELGWKAPALAVHAVAKPEKPWLTQRGRELGRRGSRGDSRRESSSRSSLGGSGVPREGLLDRTSPCYLQQLRVLSSGSQ